MIKGPLEPQPSLGGIRDSDVMYGFKKALISMENRIKLLKETLGLLEY